MVKYVDRKVTVCPVGAGHRGILTQPSLPLVSIVYFRWWSSLWLSDSLKVTCLVKDQAFLSWSSRGCKHGVCHTDVIFSSFSSDSHEETVQRDVKVNCSLGVCIWCLQAPMCACHSSFRALLCVPCGPPGKPLAIGTISQKIKNPFPKYYRLSFTAGCVQLLFRLEVWITRKKLRAKALCSMEKPINLSSFTLLCCQHSWGKWKENRNEGV